MPIRQPEDFPKSLPALTLDGAGFAELVGVPKEFVGPFRHTEPVAKALDKYAGGCAEFSATRAKNHDLTRTGLAIAALDLVEVNKAFLNWNPVQRFGLREPAEGQSEKSAQVRELAKSLMEGLTTLRDITGRVKGPPMTEVHAELLRAEKQLKNELGVYMAPLPQSRRAASEPGRSVERSADASRTLPQRRAPGPLQDALPSIPEQRPILWQRLANQQAAAVPGPSNTSSEDLNKLIALNNTLSRKLDSGPAPDTAPPDQPEAPSRAGLPQKRTPPPSVSKPGQAIKANAPGTQDAPGPQPSRVKKGLNRVIGAFKRRGPH